MYSVQYVSLGKTKKKKKNDGKTHKSGYPRMSEQQTFDGSARNIPTKLVNEIPRFPDDITNIVACVG
jgi:hypothetical protein